MTASLRYFYIQRPCEDSIPICANITLTKYWKRNSNITMPGLPYELIVSYWYYTSEWGLNLAEFMTLSLLVSIRTRHILFFLSINNIISYLFNILWNGIIFKCNFHVYGAVIRNDNLSTIYPLNLRRMMFYEIYLKDTLLYYDSWKIIIPDRVHINKVISLNKTRPLPQFLKSISIKSKVFSRIECLLWS